MIVALITVARLHPFVALIFGARTVGVVAAEKVLPDDEGPGVLTSFGSGFASTAARVGILIALGAMFAKLLADSGGADTIADTIVGRASARSLPWAMALVGARPGVLRPRQRRRLLPGQGVLRALGRPDPQDVVADGDALLSVTGLVFVLLLAIVG